MKYLNNITNLFCYKNFRVVTQIVNHFVSDNNINNEINCLTSFPLIFFLNPLTLEGSSGVVVRSGVPESQVLGGDTVQSEV